MGALFLTGGTGYLGSALARRLATEGEEVVALVRDPERAAKQLPATRLVRGDVTDLASVREAMKGCDRALHVAAHVRMWDPDPSRFTAINVGGLTHVLEASREHGLERVVYTSSFIALGPTDGRTADESWEIRDRRYYNDYERTKAEADRLARREARSGTPLVILYPGVIYGPGPATPGNLVGQTIRDYLSRKLPGMLGSGDRRICYAYLPDVVEGHLRALRTALPGERYILGGENRTMQELFDELERITSVPAPRRQIPFALATWAGRLQRWRANFFRIEPELTDEVVGIYRHEWAYSSQHAQADLGYPITPFAQGLEQTVSSFREESG